MTENHHVEAVFKSNNRARVPSREDEEDVVVLQQQKPGKCYPSQVSFTCGICVLGVVTCHPSIQVY